MVVAGVSGVFFSTFCAGVAVVVADKGQAVPLPSPRLRAGRA
ncbi:hypothetical protein [Acetobacter musti]|nr:hypothetical protein [Acetobacter musti]